MKGKKITSLLLIALFILTTLAVAIPVSAGELSVKLSGIPETPTHAAVVLGTNVVPIVTASAEWSTAQAKYGSYSVKIIQDTSSAQNTYVQLSTFPAMTGSDLTSLTDTGYWYFIPADNDGIWPGLELRFEDPDSDGWVDVCDQNIPTRDSWIEYSAENWAYYGDKEDGVSIDHNEYGHTLTEIYNEVTAAVDDPDWDNWVLVSVRVTNWEAGPPHVVYIDDITINGVLYPIELSGNVEDTVTASGSEATPFGLVEAYWENVGGAKIGEGYADNAGDYSIDIIIPEDVADEHWVVVKDVSSGVTAGAELPIETEIVLNPISGLPDDEFTVTGTGFAADDEIEILFVSTDVTPDPVPETNLLGSFDATVIVPTMSYGPYTVTAEDETSNTATDSFEIMATITLTPDEGSSGTSVEISGDGITAGSYSVTFDGVEIIETFTIGALGIFTDSFIVPTVTTAPPEGALYAVELDGISVDFNVTATTQITMTPVSGSPDSDITIEGAYFTAEEGIEVIVDFDPLLDYATFLTNSTGGFTGTIKVPTLPEDVYTIIATDENGLEADVEFTIAITAVVLDKSVGTTGTEVEVTGYGFTDTATANVTFGDTVVIEDVDVTALESGETFIIPTVPAGTYTIMVEDSVGLINTGSFEVNATTMLILTPELAPAEYIVDIEAYYFTAVDGTAISDWYIYNGTWSSTLEVDFVTPWTAVDTNATGGFLGTFVVPEIYPGDYSINATDENELFAEVSFSIIPPYTDIETEDPEYLPEETVSFDVNSTYYFDLILKVYDPEDFLYETINIVETDWMAIEDYWVIPYAASFVLPIDPVMGEWTWTAFDASEEVANGTFTVVETVEPEPEPDPVTDISLSVGWNLISLPLIPDDASIEVVLLGLVGVESVWSYDADTGLWASYSPGAPSDLDEMVDGEGYWVSMTASAVLSIDGTEMPVDPFAPLPAYPVVEGWNLIGFKSTTPMTVDDYLAGVDYVRVYEYIDGYQVVTATEDMNPGQGYWMAASDPGTIYP